MLAQGRETVTDSPKTTPCSANFQLQDFLLIILIYRQSDLRATVLFFVIRKGNSKAIVLTQYSNYKMQLFKQDATACSCASVCICVFVCTKNCKACWSRVLIYLALDQTSIGALITLIDVGYGQRLFIPLYPEQTQTQTSSLTNNRQILHFLHVKHPCTTQRGRLYVLTDRAIHSAKPLMVLSLNLSYEHVFSFQLTKATAF